MGVDPVCGSTGAPLVVCHLTDDFGYRQQGIWYLTKRKTSEEVVQRKSCKKRPMSNDFYLRVMTTSSRFTAATSTGLHDS
uniref:Uncharacterized protein n=1 Tax=Hyaloperonospora arabidopsidis (strain Emoy2) TaxID=559515 RepID=M4BCI1_HYAAE